MLEAGTGYSGSRYWFCWELVLVILGAFTGYTWSLYGYTGSWYSLYLELPSTSTVCYWFYWELYKFHNRSLSRPPQ